MEEAGDVDGITDDARRLDKIQVEYLQKPQILEKLWDEDPEAFEQSIQHLKMCLQNIKQRSNDLINVELHIEERSKHHDPVTFRCSPLWTVLSAKIKISEMYSHKLEHVYVLYRHSIAKDSMYLKDCGIEEDGDVLYVYIYSLVKTKQKSLPRHNIANVDNGITLKSIEYQNSNPSTSSINQLSSFPEQPLSFHNLDEKFELPESLKVPGAGVGELWTCKNCTFLNENWRPGCVMCSSEKPSEINVPIVEITQKMELEQESATGFTHNEAETQPEVKVEETKVGWKCQLCTFVNEPTRPGCEICSGPRPDDYQIPDGYVLSTSEQERMDREMEIEEEATRQRSLERKQNYERHISVVDQNIITSVEPVECLICFTETDPGDTIVLRECLHRFCKDCIKGHIMACEDAVVPCPYNDGSYKCDYSVTQQEIKALLEPEQFQKYLQRGLSQAEKALPNSFHCKTPDCQGWCVYDDDANTFNCPICEKKNCLTCKAIHEKLNCKQYQDELELKSQTDKGAQETKKLLEKMIKDGDAMHCPQCNIIIQKKIGCDWIKCPMCKLEICWVTKGPRWGPKGHGDTTGGCHCREYGKRCHKDCGNCH